MNYSKIYNQLIQIGKERNGLVVYEKHHIIPVCIGGTDDSDNLVDLTPEEHYVAHQLLVKIYPENRKLIYAANMMTIGSQNQHRNNKTYGWLKRRYIAECKTRIGSLNGSFGRKWHYNPLTGISSKFCVGEVPDGWLKGRVMVPCDEESNEERWFYNPDTISERSLVRFADRPDGWYLEHKSTIKELKCLDCGGIIISKNIDRKYCTECISDKRNSAALANNRKISDSDLLEALIKNELNIHKTFVSVGMSPGANYKRAKKLIEGIGVEVARTPLTR